MTYITNKDPFITHAIQIIKADYGDTVSLEAKNKDLLKFGRNQTVQTIATTLMTLPSGIYNETYVSTNIITTISSTSVSDTQTLTLEGHTISGGLFTFVTQSVTLNGQNQVTLTTPLARANRLFNNDTTDLVGTVYVYENDTSAAGVPTTATGVHLMIVAGLNNSEKAATTVSNTDYYLITSFYGDCLEKVATFGVLRLELRLAGKVFRNVIDIASNDTNNGTHDFRPYLLIPKNSDIRLRASASANGKDFTGGFQGFLLKVI